MITTGTVINMKHYSVSYGQPTNLSAPHVIVKMIHRINRRQLENKIWALEKEFSRTNKLEDPERWLILQDKLGDAYKQLMQVAKNGKNNE